MNDLSEKLHTITQQKSGIQRLTLTDFRNYKNLRVNAEIAPIIITGENGSGKTNILEALSFLAPGRGLRSAKLADIKRIRPDGEEANILAGESWNIAADILKNDEEFTIGTALQKIIREDAETDSLHGFDRRIVKINQQKITQQTELGKYVSLIWITPQMDRIFQGGPQPRRSFLDRLVYAFDIEHAKRCANFEHLYRQWLQLLKSGCQDDRWLQSVEADMATFGVAIAAARREQIARLNTFIAHEPDDIFPNVRLELSGMIEQRLDAEPALQTEDFYADYLRKQRTNILYNDGADGVNRTDFKVYFQKKNMPADLCSTGEQKALLVSIILAQTKCHILEKGFVPVILLDEITTHLDEQKRDALLQKIQNLHLQAWITSTEPQNFALLKDSAQFLPLENGRIL
ncbi:MAG: DNA replication/repair protein RecF [Alphaproteobacteria bacterium]|nr:DNA replication/repair protein RecF [Alphaproteobacteria bacterium]